MCNVLLSLEDHSIYHWNEKNLLCACVYLTSGLNKFRDISAQMRTPCIKCAMEEIQKQILKNNSLHEFCIANKTGHLTLHLCILHTI